MPQASLKRRLARLIRKVPVVVAVGQACWRLTRPHVSVGAVGVVFNEQGHLLLVEHLFHPRHPWGLPGGWVERGENPADAVTRELNEELELHVTIEAIVLVEMGFKQHMDVAYLCTPLNSVGALCGELLDYRWFALDELPELHWFHRRAVMKAVEIRGQRV